MMQRGFSLIECMVYSFLFALLAIMLFGWLSTVQGMAVRNNSDNLGIECGMDMFVRDVRMASPDPLSWKKITKHELISHVGKMDVCWLLAKNGKGEKGELFRIEGHYSVHNDTWTKKSKSLIAKKVEDLNFNVLFDERDQVMKVGYTINKKVHSVALRNRRVS